MIFSRFSSCVKAVTKCEGADFFGSLCNINAKSKALLEIVRNATKILMVFQRANELAPREPKINGQPQRQVCLRLTLKELIFEIKVLFGCGV